MRETGGFGGAGDEHGIEMKGTRDATLLEGGIPVAPMALDFRLLGKGSPITEITYHASTLPPGFELVLGEGGMHSGSQIVCKTTNVDYQWPDNTWEMTYTSHAQVTCYHGATGHVGAAKFKITVIRDSNKNGIPDFYEINNDTSALQIQPISDIHLKDGNPFAGVDVVALHEGGKQQGKVGYELQLPSGMSQYYYQRADGNYVTLVNGAPLVAWKDEELVRRVPVSARAFDEQGNKDKLTFHINVYREDMPLDKQLYIVPVPKRTVIQGQKMPPTPITVLTNMKTDIALTMEAVGFVLDEESGMLEATVFDMYSLPGRISPYDGPGSGWRETEVPGVYAVTKWQLHGPSSYLESHEETGPHPFFWDDESTSQTTSYTLKAQSLDVTAERRVLLEVHRQASGNSIAGLLPVPDKVVMDDQEMEIIRLQRVQSSRAWTEYGLKLLSQLPNGVQFSPTTGELFGRPKILDWQPFEYERKFLVDIGSSRGYITGLGFCLTVRREMMDEVALTSVDDQQVEEGKNIVPILISQVLPSPYRVEWINVDGLPQGLYVMRYGAYCRITGAPDALNNWEQEEISRVYPCTTSCKYTLHNGVVRPWAAKFTFNIEVFKQGAAQVQQQPMILIPTLLQIAPIPDRRLPESVAMEAIAFNITDPSNSGIDVTVTGLPPGVQHDLKNTIYGTPNLNDWANGEVDRNYQVQVELDNGVGQHASTQFAMTIARSPVVIPPPEALPEGDSGVPDKLPEDGGKTPPDTTGDKAPDDRDKIPADTTTGDIPEGYEIPWGTSIGRTEFPPLQPVSAEGLPRIGVAQWEAAQGDFLQALVLELAQQGYIHGQNMELKPYAAEGDEQKALESLKRMEQDDCTMVIAVGDRMSSLAKQSLQGRIPLVFAGVTDPLGLRLVNQSGEGIGPVTGVTAPDLRHGLLAAIKQIQPMAHSAGFLSSLNDAAAEGMLQLAPYAGLRLVTMPSISAGEEALKQAMADTDILILMDEPDPEQLALILRLAAENGKALYARTASQVQQGAFMACLTDVAALGRHTAGLVAQLLKGAEVQALSVITSTSKLLVYNVEPLGALSLTAPVDATPVAP